MAYDPREKFEQPNDAIGPLTESASHLDTLLTPEALDAYAGRLQAGEDRDKVITEMAMEEVAIREALEEVGLLPPQEIPAEVFADIEPEALEESVEDDGPHFHPEGPIHVAADAHVEELREMFNKAFEDGRQAVLGVLVKSDEEIADRAADAIHASLAAQLPRALLKVMTAGGEVTSSEMRSAEFRAAKRKEDKTPPKQIGPIKFHFNSKGERAAAWAREHAGWLIEGITQTTREKIQEVIAQAQEGKISLKDQWQKIAAAVGDDDRAQMIARTESMTAVNAGQREAWDQAVEEGLLSPNTRKMWIATGDEGVCPDCEELDGYTVDLDEKYPSPGDDGPPAHPNCRCTEGLA